MKRFFVPITFLSAVAFLSCTSKTIKVTSLPPQNEPIVVSTTTTVPSMTTTTTPTTTTHTNSAGTTTTTTVMPPAEMILKEEYVDARVAFLPTDDLTIALAKAKEEKKPIFIDFYADWCAPCKVLDDGVFHDYDVAEFMNKNVINLKVNIEKGNGAALKQKMYVSALPTLLFLDPNGNEIARKEALPLINDFKKMMKTAVWKVKNPSGQP
ncbi:MAG: thioredoxin family protein [Saprospiraceae bacterium]|nr:thioredoxin family protein [Saprospiraceae bacterium]